MATGGGQRQNILDFIAVVSDDPHVEVQV